MKNDTISQLGTMTNKCKTVRVFSSCFHVFPRTIRSYSTINNTNTYDTYAIPPLFLKLKKRIASFIPLLTHSIANHFCVFNGRCRALQQRRDFFLPVETLKNPEHLELYSSRLPVPVYYNIKSTLIILRGENSKYNQILSLIVKLGVFFVYTTVVVLLCTW